MRFALVLLCVSLVSCRSVRNDHSDDRSRETEISDDRKHDNDDRRDDRSARRDEQRDDRTDDRQKSSRESARSNEVPPMSPLADEIDKINQAEEESMEREDSRERRLLDNVAHPLEYGTDESSHSRENSASGNRRVSGEDPARNDYDHEDSAHPYENPDNRNRIPPQSNAEYDVRDDSPRKDASASREDSGERNDVAPQNGAPNADSRIPERYKSTLDRGEDETPPDEQHVDEDHRSKESNYKQRDDDYPPRPRSSLKAAPDDRDDREERQRNSRERYSQPNVRRAEENYPREHSRRLSTQRPPHEGRRREISSKESDGRESPNEKPSPRAHPTRPPRKPAALVTNKRNPRAIIPVYESFLPHEKSSLLSLGQARPISRGRQRHEEPEHRRPPPRLEDAEREPRRPPPPSRSQEEPEGRRIPQRSRDEPPRDSNRASSVELDEGAEDTRESDGSREADPPPAPPPRRPPQQDKFQPEAVRWKSTTRRPSSNPSSRTSEATLQAPRPPTSAPTRPQKKTTWLHGTTTSSSTTSRPAVRPWRWQGNVNIGDDDFFRIPEKFGEFGARLGVGIGPRSTTHFSSPTTTAGGKGQSRRTSSSEPSPKSTSDAAAEASRFHDSFRAYDGLEHAMHSSDEHSALSNPGQASRSTKDAQETRKKREPTPTLAEDEALNAVDITSESFWKNWKPPSDLVIDVPQATTPTSQTPIAWKTYQTPKRVTTKEVADGQQKTTLQGSASVGWFKLEDQAAQPDFLRAQQSQNNQTATLPSFTEWRPPTKKSTNHSGSGHGFKGGGKVQPTRATILALVLKPEAHLIDQVHDRNKNATQLSRPSKDSVPRPPQTLPVAVVQKKPIANNIPVLKSTPILQKRSGDLYVAASQRHEQGPDDPHGGKKHEEFDKNYDKTKQSILHDFRDMNKDNHYMPSEYVISVKYKNSTNKEAEKRLKSRGFTETHHRLVERFEIIHQHENSEERVGTEEPTDPDQAAVEESKDSRVKAMSEDNMRQMRNGGDISANQVERPPIEVRTLLHGYRGIKPYETVYRGNHPESVHQIPSEGFPINDRFKNWVHRDVKVRRR